MSSRRKSLALLAVILLASCGQIGLRLRTVTVAGSGILTITTTSLAACTANVDCGTETLIATGGTAPRTWAEVGSSLGSGACTGVSVASTGVITKAPTTAGTCTATYRVTDNVAATKDVTLAFTVSSSIPSPWTCTDIGSPAVAGSSSESSGTWTITGSGIHWATSDQMHDCYQPLTGSQQIVGRVTNCTTTGSAERCQLEYRSSLAADAANLVCGTGVVSGTQYNLSSWRLTTAASTGATVVAGSEQYYQITVDTVANQVICNYSADGVTYNAVATQTITVPATYYLGMSAGEINPATSTATITTVSVSAWAGTPPVTDFGGYRPLWQGFGTRTVGGRGGIVCAVNALTGGAASGAAVGGAGNPDYRGNLRYCLVTRTEPRVVVFETTGYITLTSAISLESPFVTIAGQTAPSPGITIRGYPLNVHTHDVVIQHLRFRLGSGNPVCDSGFRFGIPGQNNTGVFNVVLDHDSFSWSHSTQVASISGAQDVAVLDSILGQTFEFDTVHCGSESSGAVTLLYGTANSTGTYLRNLFVNGMNRNPWISAGTRAVHVNNVTYNAYCPASCLNSWPYGMGQIVGTDPNYASDLVELVSDSNVLLTGPSTGSGAPMWRVALGTGQLPSQVYLANNSRNTTTLGATSIAADQWNTNDVWFCTGTTCGPGHGGSSGVLGTVRITSLPSWYTSPTAWTGQILPITNTGTAIQTYVLLHSGARPQDRDSVDTQLVLDVTAGTGSNAHTLTTEVTVGGYPSLATNPRAYVVPATPNSPGTCGTTAAGVVRTIIECDLESGATFGAQRLE